MTSSDAARLRTQAHVTTDAEKDLSLRSNERAQEPFEQVEHICLAAGDTSLVIACATGTRATIVHWGSRMEHTSPQLIQLMSTRQHAHGGPDVEIVSSLLNEVGTGIGGGSGFCAHRDGKDWGSVFLVERVKRLGEHEVCIVSRDSATQIQVSHKLRLDPESEVLACETSVLNEGNEALSLDWCAALCLPLDERVSRLLGFSGRWAGEFVVEEVPAFTGAYLRENKSGRTSHDSFPGLIAAAPKTDEVSGITFGFHLGWSGNNRVRVDRLSDGRAFVQMGEYFFPGEMNLAPGESYKTPTLFAAASIAGHNTLSQRFHRYLRTQVLDNRTRTKPRPVHYNTWESVYFDHDEATLLKLADRAADVGAERFVLDDGWFGGRRNDRAGLGDWWVSPEVYPKGLHPLIEKVAGLGMEFGLWLEPEMVNPDSDLYRTHPDWVLRVDGVQQVPFRGQYVLDLTRDEVTRHLYAAIDALLKEYAISYIKWDMNRDTHHPGSGGRAAISAQTRALYALLARLRAAHPDIEIETCASGGGRADFGILQHTDRIWTSDSNDALDRQRIQRGASYFFPLDVVGAHVGPNTCHITGRRLSMEMRVATAFFGHMGMELNLLDETPEDLAVLKAGIALHKKSRNLLHNGEFIRLDTPEHVNAVGVVSVDKARALFSWANLTGHKQTLPARMFFTGLDAERNYRVRIIWPAPATSRTSPSIIEEAGLGGKGTRLPGEALMQIGLQVPLLNPETCLIYELVAE